MITIIDDQQQKKTFSNWKDVHVFVLPRLENAESDDAPVEMTILEESDLTPEQLKKLRKVEQMEESEFICIK